MTPRELQRMRLLDRVLEEQLPLQALPSRASTSPPRRERRGCVHRMKQSEKAFGSMAQKTRFERVMGRDAARQFQKTAQPLPLRLAEGLHVRKTFSRADHAADPNAGHAGRNRRDEVEFSGHLHEPGGSLFVPTHLDSEST